MTAPRFKIPAEYRDQLSYRPSSDSRTDAEIIASLANHVPVTSEKNIWAFWHSGAANMPAWCRRNVASWVRMHDPSWTVRVLDNVPGSPNYGLKYALADQLPDCFVKSTMDGAYTGPHSADFLRGALLHQHGGIFVDAGCILFRTVDRICWDQLADPNSPYQVSVPWTYGQSMANAVVAARKGDPFIKRWHDLFMHLWKGRTDHVGLSSMPLMTFNTNMPIDYSGVERFRFDFKVSRETILDYVTQVACWTRLALLEDVGDGFSGADYCCNHVLLFDAMDEIWAIEETLDWKYARALELLASPLDADPESEQYKAAQGLVYRLLTQSSMQKITHAKHLTTTPSLGVLWEQPENADKDAAEGTFAELMRWGAENFEQTRPGIRYVKAPVPLATIKKGLLEP